VLRRYSSALRFVPGGLPLVALLLAIHPAVAEGVRVNGVRLEIIPLRWSGSLEAARVDLRGGWGDPVAATPSTRPDEPARLLFARQLGALHETLSLRAIPGSRHMDAVIAVHDLRDAPARVPPAPFVLPPGIRLLSVIEHGIASDAPTTYTLESRLDPVNAAALVRNSAQHAGWRIGVIRTAAPVIVAERGTARLLGVAIPIAKGSRLLLQRDARQQGSSR
jgi:hypothetical protein